MEDLPLRVLLIEDNPADARMIHEMLKGLRDRVPELTTADSLSTGIETLARGGQDAVLLDLSLPDSQGFDTFLKVREQAGAVPIVLLTGLDDEVFAVRAVKEGAQDYLIKGQVDGHLLSRAIRYAIERSKLLRELRDALAKVKTLSGMIPICAWCRKIRNDKGYWDQVEEYIESRSNATFTHGICPECSEKMRT
jgi:two-component system cell cycle sensor histidine kinase/response regulator CckA